MEKVQPNMRVISVVSKSLVISYIITAIILAILSLIYYKADLGDQTISIVILITYVISCFIGGFLSGKALREKKFLWGLVTGGMYFAIILILSLMLGSEGAKSFASYSTMALVCLGSGMLGGMLS